MKVKNLIPYKYYKVIYNRLNDHKKYCEYFQFKEIINDMIYNTGYVIDNTTYKVNYDFYCSKNYITTNDISEVNLSEFIDYLPNNHPDKICFLRREKISYLLNAK